jgi:arsenate reductase
MPKEKKILFLCTGNSCRSQMAEAWTRSLKKELLVPYSAGIQPKGVDPRAVKAMKEKGIDISGRSSKDIDVLSGIEFDFVVTLCDNAQESCPFFPGKTKVVHRGFDDPPRLAAGAGSEDDAMAPYRRVRDEIRDFVQKLPEALLEG